MNILEVIFEKAGTRTLRNLRGYCYSLEGAQIEILNTALTLLPNVKLLQIAVKAGSTLRKERAMFEHMFFGKVKKCRHL